MLILLVISRMILLWPRRNLQGPNDEPNQGDNCQTSFANFTTILTALHSQHALAELYSDNDDLGRSKELANVLYSGRKPSIEISALVARTEEKPMESRCEPNDCADNGT